MSRAPAYQGSHTRRPESELGLEKEALAEQREHPRTGTPPVVPTRTCWVSNSPNLPPPSPITPGETLSCHAHRQGERSASGTKPIPFSPRSTVSPARWHPWPRCSAPLGPPVPALCPNFGCFSGRNEPQGAEAAEKGRPFIWDRCFPPVSGQGRYLGKTFPVVFQHFLYSDRAIREQLPGTSMGSGASPRTEQPKGPRRVSWSISQCLSVAGTGLVAKP